MPVFTSGALLVVCLGGIAGLVPLALGGAPLAAIAHAAAPTPVKVFAAGSLMAPLRAVANAVRREHGIEIEFTFGPSGTLRERLERGEAADIFASANMEHPQALHAAGRSGDVRLFTRNTLCAFTRPDVKVDSGSLIDRLLDPGVKVGTSTPVSDPAGDYTWLMFRRVDGIRSGAYETLDRKALQLFGGANPAPAPPVPPSRNATAFHLSTRTVDIYIQYCSGRAAFVRDSPELVVVPVPPALDVGAEYGMTIMNGAGEDAGRVAAFILSPAGQALFGEAGFGALPDRPRP